ncbi:hypothetical protein YTPLAS18_20520 [Nitrospira sp.]|nr:hypothetical protein YTPLAS18_20520 [Nitrospira sp.]
MAEQFFNIPRKIVRNGSSLSSGGNNSSAELTIIDLPKEAFVLQLASVWVMEQGPIEHLSAFMVIRDNTNAPVANLSIPIYPSARLRSDGSGIFIGNVQGPIPVKRNEKLCFQVQWKAGTGTFSFHADAWGFAL